MIATGGVPGTGVRSIAFFDVDETLIGPKSMFSFLEFHLRDGSRSAGSYERAVAELSAAAARGVPRRDVNRLYYRLMAGESAVDLRARGREWFAEAALDPGFWHSPVLERLSRHRAEGDLVVLLSGSFFACLEPVGEAAGAHWALGTRPVVRDGFLTGEVLVPMIGATKGTAARAAAAVHAVPLADCTAYGDHASDLPLLSAVGRPVAVGEDAVLAEHAETHGWERIRLAPHPTTAGTAPVGGASRSSDR
ncbi:HAD family phosphatase [Nocardiopsis sp. NRRL B-16309]|uniref:HAD family hydrolase n=1 Tax=Nocardiopsis sp. NRRL B-16309 TaxID=1519494 RepID=UPI0006AF2797|nr:HAD-IB family hydrolase [Nocardiopsis sp. NRRL B-16309]KOX12620.1 HAD family hydrolase [Nocardiopsis sp. NRRL B-16309]